jgi:hypothetical protein
MAELKLTKEELQNLKAAFQKDAFLGKFSDFMLASAQELCDKLATHDLKDIQDVYKIQAQIAALRYFPACVVELMEKVKTDEK